MNHDNIETEAIEAGHECKNERRLRAIEKVAADHTTRLHDGDIRMVTLNASIDRLADAVDRLEKRLDRQEAGSPVVGKIKDAAISWAVPVAIVCALWVLAHAGIIPGLAAKP